MSAPPKPDGELHGPGPTPVCYALNTSPGRADLTLWLTEETFLAWPLTPDGATEFGQCLVLASEGINSGAGDVDLCGDPGAAASLAFEIRPDSMEGGCVAFFLGVNDLVEVSWEVTTASASALGQALLEVAERARV